MTVTTARHFTGTERRKLWMTCRRVTAVIGLFVLMSQTTFADSLQLNQVVQSLNPTQGLVDLRLNSLMQDPVSPDVKGTVSSRSEKTKSSQDLVAPPPTVRLEVSSQQQQIGVEVVGDAIVEGTVCDCGEIIVPGGFPKWPLIFLAAIPLIFIHDCDDCNTECLTCDTIVTPTLTPTLSNNTTVPEPAALFLFGTGLLGFGAGLRRRYSKSTIAPQNQTENE